MALVNPALMGTLSTVASITSMATGNPAIASAAKGIQVGTMGISAASQLLSRPKITASGSGRSPYGSGSSGGSSQPRNINTNAVTAIIKNLETIIMRIETSNSYLKAIAEELSPKAKKEIARQFADQNKLLFETYSTKLGKIFINSFGKEFMQRYSRMNNVFGKALQNGSVSNSQLMMFRVFGNMPFFKDFFGNIQTIIKESKDTNEEIKITIKNIIPNKIDAIIHLLNQQNTILGNSQTILSRLGTHFMGRGSGKGSYQALLDKIYESNTDMNKTRMDIMKKAMYTLEDMNKNLVTFRGALLNMIDTPLKLIKTAISWFIRFKIASSFILPFAKAFGSTGTGKSLVKNYYTGTFLESGVSATKNFVSGIKSGITGKNEDPNNLNKENAFVEFLRNQGKKVSEYYKKISKEQWFIDLMNSIKKAFITGITNVMKTVTMVILSYRITRAGAKSVWNWFTKSNVFSRFTKELADTAKKSFKSGYENPFSFKDERGKNIGIKRALKYKFRDIKGYIGNIGNSIKEDMDLRVLKAQRSDLEKNYSIFLDESKYEIEKLKKNLAKEKEGSAEYNHINERITNMRNTRAEVAEKLKEIEETSDDKLKGMVDEHKKMIENAFKDNQLEEQADFGDSEGKKKGLKGMLGGLLSGGKGILKVGKDLTKGIISFVSNGISRVMSIASKLVNWAGIAIMVGTALRTGLKMMFTFAGKDKELMKSKSNSDFIKKLLSGTLSFIFKSVFKAFGYAFNPTVWKAIGTGIYEGVKSVFKYWLAAMVGGGLSLVGSILPAKMGAKLRNWAINGLGLSKEWELISSAFNSSRNENVNLVKMSKDAAAKEDEQNKESLEAQKQTAQNTLKMVDYLKPKNLSLGFGVGIHKMSKVLSKILGMAGADVNKFEQENLERFTNWSNSSNEYKANIGKGYVGAEQGKTWAQLITANGENSTAIKENTDATKNLTTAATELIDQKKAEEQAKKDDERVKELRNSAGYNQVSDSDIAYGTLTNEELDKVKPNKESIEAIRQRKTGEYDIRLARGWDKLVDKFQVWAGRDDNVPSLNINTKGPKGMIGDPVTRDTSATEIINALKRSIKISEGKKLTRYTDSLGYPTIGYGHKLRPGENYTNITEEEANKIFDSDYNRIYAQISKNEVFRSADPLTQAVLMDLSFNMGPYFLGKFPNFSKALSQKDFETASKELLNSSYAGQVKKRALRNAAALRTGIFYEDRMNPKVGELLSDYISYPTRNSSPLVEPSDSEVLQWLRPIGENVTNEKILALNPYLKYNLVNYAKDKGKVLEVTSALRTREEQEVLYKKKGGVGVAKPGHSRHESGFAIDINSKTGLLDTALLAKHNLHRPVNNEPWHVELKGNARNIAMAKAGAGGSGGAAYGMTGSTSTGEEGGTDPVTNFFSTLSFLLTGTEIGDPAPIDNSILMKYPPLRKLVNIITKREMDTNFDIMETGSTMTGNEVGNKVKTIGNMISDPVNTAAKCMVKFAEIVTNDKSGGSIGNNRFNNTNVVTNVSPTNIMSANSQTANSGNSGRDSNNIGIMDMGLAAFMI